MNNWKKNSVQFQCIFRSSAVNLINLRKMKCEPLHFSLKLEINTKVLFGFCLENHLQGETYVGLSYRFHIFIPAAMIFNFLVKMLGFDVTMFSVWPMKWLWNRSISLLISVYISRAKSTSFKIMNLFIPFRHLFNFILIPPWRTHIQSASRSFRANFTIDVGAFDDLVHLKLKLVDVWIESD